MDLNAGTGATLSPWVSATLKGNVTSKATSDSSLNRSGTLDITIEASEAPMPEGLAKILSLLSNSITA